MYMWGETVIERRADVQYPREAVIPHNDLAPRSGTPNTLNIIAYLINTNIVKIIVRHVWPGIGWHMPYIRQQSLGPMIQDSVRDAEDTT